jgi:hypothetical protein
MILTISYLLSVQKTLELYVVRNVSFQEEKKKDIGVIYSAYILRDNIERHRQDRINKASKFIEGVTIDLYPLYFVLLGITFLIHSFKSASSLGDVV